eukprot:TRINITY_DN3796_c0_g1_i1.p1 TRINITY_DN3796_c0_g1~~TRINITY_DN3796_c0_g1_i1.p1  ORF type:complete len:1319 (-),score=433.21 TRINITY_DN3796_c0_g1_i1:2069-5563(-)
MAPPPTTVEQKQSALSSKAADPFSLFGDDESGPALFGEETPLVTQPVEEQQKQPLPVAEEQRPTTTAPAENPLSEASQFTEDKQTPAQKSTLQQSKQGEHDAALSEEKADDGKRLLAEKLRMLEEKKKVLEALRKKKEKRAAVAAPAASTAKRTPAAPGPVASNTFGEPISVSHETSAAEKQQTADEIAAPVKSALEAAPGSVVTNIFGEPLLASREVKPKASAVPDERKRLLAQKAHELEEKKKRLEALKAAKAQQEQQEQNQEERKRQLAHKAHELAEKKQRLEALKAAKAQKEKETQEKQERQQKLAERTRLLEEQKHKLQGLHQQQQQKGHRALPPNPAERSAEEKSSPVEVTQNVGTEKKKAETLKGRRALPPKPAEKHEEQAVEKNVEEKVCVEKPAEAMQKVDADAVEEPTPEGKAEVVSEKKDEKAPTTKKSEEMPVTEKPEEEEKQAAVQPEVKPSEERQRKEKATLEETLATVAPAEEKTIVQQLEENPATEKPTEEPLFADASTAKLFSTEASEAANPLAETKLFITGVPESKSVSQFSVISVEAEGNYFSLDFPEKPAVVSEAKSTEETPSAFQLVEKQTEAAEVPTAAKESSSVEIPVGVQAAEESTALEKPREEPKPAEVPPKEENSDTSARDEVKRKLVDKARLVEEKREQLEALRCAKLALKQKKAAEEALIKEKEAHVELKNPAEGGDVLVTEVKLDAQAPASAGKLAEVKTEEAPATYTVEVKEALPVESRKLIEVTGVEKLAEVAPGTATAASAEAYVITVTEKPNKVEVPEDERTTAEKAETAAQVAASGTNFVEQTPVEKSAEVKTEAVLVAPKEEVTPEEKPIEVFTTVVEETAVLKITEMETPLLELTAAVSAKPAEEKALVEAEVVPAAEGKSQEASAVIAKPQAEAERIAELPIASGQEEHRRKLAEKTRLVEEHRKRIEALRREKLALKQKKATQKELQADTQTPVEGIAVKSTEKKKEETQAATPMAEANQETEAPAAAVTAEETTAVEKTAAETPQQEERVASPVPEVTPAKEKPEVAENTKPAEHTPEEIEKSSEISVGLDKPETAAETVVLAQDERRQKLAEKARQVEEQRQRLAALRREKLAQKKKSLACENLPKAPAPEEHRKLPEPVRTPNHFSAAGGGGIFFVFARVDPH